MLRVIVIFALLIQLVACAIAPGFRIQSPPNYDQPAKAKPNFIPITSALLTRMRLESPRTHDEAYYYHVGQHDILNIYVWGHPEFNPPVSQIAAEGGGNAAPTLAPVGYLVGSDGDIFFPMLGTVHVAGKTVEQNREQLANLLKKYVKNPQVEVRVMGFRSKKIYIIGEVMKPGLQPITDAPMSITDALTLAGGLDPKSADPSHIFVIRGSFTKPDVYWLDAESADALLLGENFRLKPNDVVFVSTTNVARWNRAIDLILPSIQTVWFTQSLINQWS